MRQGHEAFEQHPGGRNHSRKSIRTSFREKRPLQSSLPSLHMEGKTLEVASRLLGRDMIAEKGDVVRWLEAEGMTRLTGEASV